MPRWLGFLSVLFPTASLPPRIPHIRHSINICRFNWWNNHLLSQEFQGNVFFFRIEQRVEYGSDSLGLWWIEVVVCSSGSLLIGQYFSPTWNIFMWMVEIKWSFNFVAAHCCFMILHFLLKEFIFFLSLVTLLFAQQVYTNHSWNKLLVRDALRMHCK